VTSPAPQSDRQASSPAAGCSHAPHRTRDDRTLLLRRAGAGAIALVLVIAIVLIVRAILNHQALAG